MAALAPAAGRMLGTPASEGLAAARPRASLMGTKVPSMLFELEMEEAGGEEASSEHTLSAVAACRRTILGSLTPASAQVAAVVEAALAGSTTGQQQQQQAGDPCSRLAEALVAAGYETCLRQTVGGGAGGQCLRNLTHSFLICSPGRHSSAAELCVIVDPSFRDQFAIAHPTPRYTAVLAALPAVLICQADRIQPLVELLCGEMCLAFQGMGIVLPPWRYAKSMLSKWLPRRGSVDLTFGPSGAAAISSAAAAVAARRRSSPGDPSQGSGGSSASCLTNTNNNSGSANSDSGSRERGRHGAALPRLLAGGGSNVATSRAIAVAPPCNNNTSGNGCHPARMGSGKAALLEPLQRVVGGFGFPVATAFAAQ